MTVERLYTPWRLDYVTANGSKPQGCVFCAVVNNNPENDADNFLVYRGQTVFAVMNIYPYNTGHLMLLPYQHVATLAETPALAQIELIQLTSYFTELLAQVLRPDGFNVGLNMGRAAGAGIDSHLHLHIVPRWNGDSNFMTVVGQTRVLPEMLGDTYRRILDQLKAEPPLLST